MVVFSDVKRCQHSHFTQFFQKAKEGIEELKRREVLLSFLWKVVAMRMMSASVARAATREMGLSTFLDQARSAATQCFGKIH